MRALLDVNVLIALFDANHVHHERCMRWLDEHVAQGWASCPLTQNGCVRILSQKSYPNAVPAEHAAVRLHEATQDPAHQFWPDSISLLEPGAIDWRRLLSGRHLSDAYLLALAVTRRGRLVTLDEAVPLAAVKGAGARHLVVIA
jgi:toxin-antitoxin system PIN domain toxin